MSKVKLQGCKVTKYQNRRGPVFTVWMAKVYTVTCLFTSKYAFVYCITILVIAARVFYQNYAVRELIISKAVHEHCNWMKTKTEGSRNSTPPWFSLLADYKATLESGSNLYVWHVGMRSSRLGNRLFNYAAIFGIAWRNRRIPIWPVYRLSKEHDITQHFNLRIPVDRRKRITNVSSMYLQIYH